MYDTIKSAQSWAHPMESLWFIKTSDSVQTWSDRLMAVVDRNDSLFVVDITNQPRQGWMYTKIWEWLSNN